MSLSLDQIAYGQQKNRENIYSHAINERGDLKAHTKDISSWNVFDDAWVDYRYMELCAQSNITPW